MLRTMVWTLVAAWAVLLPAPAAWSAAPTDAPARETAPAPKAAADGGQREPLFVVALAGYDALYGDLDFLGKISDQPELARGLEGFLILFTNNQGLAGIDKARPWGGIVDTDGQDFRRLTFIPVTDLEQTFAALAGLIGEPEELEDGVFRFQTPAASVYVQEHNGWAFIGQSEEDLDDLPDNPVALLDGLAKQYDIAVKLHVQRIPAPLREMAIDQMKQGFRLAEEQLPGEGDADFELGRMMNRGRLEATQQMIEELDWLTVGLRIDAETKRAHLDFDFVAVEGSDLAKQFATPPAAPSNFAGFLQPGAALALHSQQQAAEADIDAMLESSETMRDKCLADLDEASWLGSDQERDLAKGFVNELFDLLDQTLETGRLDGGLLFTGVGDERTVVVGGRLVDAEKIEDIVKRIADLTSGSSDFPTWKLNVEEYQGLRIHEAAMDAPPIDEESVEQLRKVFGDHWQLTLAVGQEKVLFAVGSQGKQTIKQILDGSVKPAADLPQMSVRLGLGAALKNLSEMDDADPALAQLVELLDGAEADHVNVTVGPVPQGARMRIEAEQDVLRLLMKQATSRQGGRRGGDRPPRAGDLD